MPSTARSAAQAVPVLGREQVDVPRLRREVDLLALLRGAAPVDPGDDLVLLVAHHGGAVHVGVGAQLLDDGDLDVELGAPALGVRRVLEVLGADADDGAATARQPPFLVERDPQAGQLDGAVVDPALHEVHRG